LDLHGLIDRHGLGDVGGFRAVVGGYYVEASFAHVGAVGEWSARGFLHRDVTVGDEVVDGDILAVGRETAAFGIGDGDQIIAHADDIDGCGGIRRSSRSGGRLDLLLVDVGTDA